MRTAIYVRISRDSTGDGLGVERHEAECRALCEARSWKVAEVYTDNDISASNGKRRPEYERMIEDVRAGGLDAIVAWHPDRLHRSPRELEAFLAVIERHGVEVETVRAGSWNFTPTGKLAIRMLGNIAKYETEHKAERQRSANVQSAAAGKVHGGGTRAFGYAEDGVRLVEDEAAIIREMAQRLLAGESQNSLARDLAARGVTTSTGKTWKPDSIRRTMKSARLSGRREHLGEIVCDQADWPPIISVEDSDRLRRRFARTTRRSGAPVKYLLSGLLVCGRCRYPMVGKPKGDTKRYVCRTIAGSGQCGGTVTDAARADNFVRDMVLDRLSGPATRNWLAARRRADPKVAEELAALKARRSEYLDMFDKDELSRAELAERSTPVLARIEALEKKQARLSGPDPLTGFVGTYEQLADRWELMNNSQRRAVCDAVLEKIEVMPAASEKGVKGRWDPSRFQPFWRA